MCCFVGRAIARGGGCAPGEEGEVGGANVRKEGLGKEGTYECDGAGFVYRAKTDKPGC